MIEVEKIPGIDSSESWCNVKELRMAALLNPANNETGNDI